MTDERLVLHGSFTSSSSYKPMLFLALSGLPFSFRTVNLKNGVQKEAAHLAINRYGQVPVLRDGVGGMIRYLPAHPHEGGVGAPADDPTARVIATGRSKATGKDFNIAVAFEPSAEGGPAIAQSTFHHFADYNWDPDTGAPSFVSEPPGGALKTTPEAKRQTELYVSNLARWLGGRAQNRKRHLDEELDEALEESFPASDPPAVL